MTQDAKGKTKGLSMVCLEKCGSSKDLMVMPIGKRSTKKKEGGSTIGSNKRKGKVHLGEDAKVRWKRRACKKVHVSNFPLGEGQSR